MAKVALLIGVSEYEPGLNPLPAAVKDVEAMREVLLHEQMGGFTEDDITVLKNPNRQVMEEEIETLFTRGRKRNDLILLFFSGHGIKDDMGRLFLATRETRKDERGELMRATAVSSSFVQESMGRSRSKRLVVMLDSCFSGAFAEGLSAKDDGSVDIRAQLGGEGRAILASSGSTQYSFEQEQEELSLYTRYLVEGIRTGEADGDGDEFISADELHDYAAEKVREFRPEMKPEFIGIREGAKIHISKVSLGDPKKRYSKEVSQFIERGEISIVGRYTLDVLRIGLSIEKSEANKIENEILGECRAEFQEKLKTYEQAFRELFEQESEISKRSKKHLEKLRIVLGLRNEDTKPIEAKLRGEINQFQEDFDENLLSSNQRYKKALEELIAYEHPLSKESRRELTQLAKTLQLSDEIAKEIENRALKTKISLSQHKKHELPSRESASQKNKNLPIYFWKNRHSKKYLALVSGILFVLLGSTYNVITSSNTSSDESSNTSSSLGWRVNSDTDSKDCKTDTSSGLNTLGDDLKELKVFLSLSEEDKIKYAEENPVDSEQWSKQMKCTQERIKKSMESN